MTPVLSIWTDSAAGGLPGPALVLLVVLAFGLSFMAGVVGMALGVIRLPLLIAFGIPPLVSAGTNLAVTVTDAVASGWPHYRAGRVAMRVVLMMGVPALIGAFIGARFSTDFPLWVLYMIIAFLLAWSGLVGVVRGLAGIRHVSGGAEQLAAPRPTPAVMARETGVGFIIGLVGGAVGLVLGTVRMPALVNVLKLPPTIAIGTNTFIGLLVGVFGFAGHALNGNVDVVLIVLLGAVGMVGGYLGATQTGRLNPHTLRTAIGVVLILISPLMVYQSISYFPD